MESSCVGLRSISRRHELIRRTCRTRNIRRAYDHPARYRPGDNVRFGKSAADQTHRKRRGGLSGGDRWSYANSDVLGVERQSFLLSVVNIIERLVGRGRMNRENDEAESSEHDRAERKARWGGFYVGADG